MRDRRSGSDGFSEYLVGSHPLPERRCALRFKASAATMQSLLHQGANAPYKSRRASPLSQNTYVLPPLLITPKGNPMSPLKNMAAPSPAKMQAHEMHEKAGSISNTCAQAPLRDDMKEALHKARIGTNRPRVQRWITWVYIIMTAANCSPAVASRRAKYDDDFRVPTLLEAIEPEKGGKLAHERLQSALPVRAKTRRQPSRLMGPQGCSAGATL